MLLLNHEDETRGFNIDSVIHIYEEDYTNTDMEYSATLFVVVTSYNPDEERVTFEHMPIFSSSLAEVRNAKRILRRISQYKAMPLASAYDYLMTWEGDNPTKILRRLTKADEAQENGEEDGE